MGPYPVVLGGHWDHPCPSRALEPLRNPGLPSAERGLGHSAASPPPCIALLFGLDSFSAIHLTYIYPILQPFGNDAASFNEHSKEGDLACWHIQGFPCFSIGTLRRIAL